VPRMGAVGLRLRLARLLSGLAGLALAFAAAVTLADIGLRTLSRLLRFMTGQAYGYGLVGAVDLVQLGIVAAAAFAIPQAFLTDGHVAVDFLHRRLPVRWRRRLDVLARLLGFAFLLLLFLYGRAQLETVLLFGDRSVTLQLPMSAYWIPFLAGLALSALAAVLSLFPDRSRRRS